MGLKKAKALYEKYKGKKWKDENGHGVVCGYFSDSDGDLLIGAVTDDNPGWEAEKSKYKEFDHIITHQDNPKGYWYITEKDIIN